MFSSSKVKKDADSNDNKYSRYVKGRGLFEVGFYYITREEKALLTIIGVSSY